MRNIIPLSIIALVFGTIWFSSCTKEVLDKVYLTDTIKINTNTITHDTVKYIVGMDSVKANFTYVLYYQSDSMSYCSIKASTASQNVPTNASYTWVIDGDLYSVAGQNFIAVGFDHSQNGSHILSMTVTCPDTKKTYTVVKSFITKLKG
jgi:hypothetical protein